MGKLCERHIVLTQDGLAREHRLQMTPRRGFSQQRSPLALGTFPWIQGHKATMLSEERGKNKVVKDKSRGVKLTVSAILIPSLA